MERCKIEDRKYEICIEVMRHFFPSADSDSSELEMLGETEDFFDNNDDFFGGPLEFEMNLEEGMQRDLEGGSALFPWDPG